MSVLVAAAPQMETEQREHSVDKGETLKVKIPFSGTGPFSFKLKKGNREIPDSDRVKLIPFEDYVILQIKGISTSSANIRSSFQFPSCGNNYSISCLCSGELPGDNNIINMITIKYEQKLELYRPSSSRWRLANS